MKRILLFVLTNLAVVLVLGVVASLLGVNRYLTANGLNLGALLGLCHEIAGYYRLPQADANTVEQLLSAERLAASPSPEMAELVELAQHAETWLAKLLNAYHALFQPPREIVPAKQDVTMPLITAVTLEDEVQPVSVDELEFCRQQLKELALRFRGSLSEW